jgi:hypothetical protein
LFSGHDEENKAPKNRLDALQEIVMKSKLYKLQKKEVKEEQVGSSALVCYLFVVIY